MGFGFTAISSTVGIPMWEALLNANRFSAPLFAFWITRFGNDSSATEFEPGGVLTLGGTNSSLYTGEIEFIDMPAVSRPTFWQLIMTGQESSPRISFELNQKCITGFSINGNQISITRSTALSAFDIGTTLIGGPTADVNRIWAAVPDALALNGSNAGYFSIRESLQNEGSWQKPDTFCNP